MINMTSFVLGQAFIITALVFLSQMPESKKWKFLFMGLGLSELILIPTFFYVIEAGGNIVPLLRVNFWIMIILAWGMGLIAIYDKVVNTITQEETVSKEERNRFKRDF